MKRLLLISILLIAAGCTDQNMAADTVIKSLESACVTNKGEYQAIDGAMKAMGARRNGKNDWFFMHEADAYISQHHQYTAEEKCEAEVTGWGRYNDPSKLKGKKQINYKSFKKKFAGHFKAKHLPEKSETIIGDDHYIFEKDGQKYFVIMEDDTDSRSKFDVWIMTEELAIEKEAL